jgi:hypothetical protein
MENTKIVKRSMYYMEICRNLHGEESISFTETTHENIITDMEYSDIFVTENEYNNILTNRDLRILHDSISKQITSTNVEYDIMNNIANEVDAETDTELEQNSKARILPYYQASTTCSDTGYATAPVYYTYYYYAGVNYYYYYCCPSGGSVSGSSCYYYYGATPVTYGQYECRAGGTMQSDGRTCLRNNC